MPLNPRDGGRDAENKANNNEHEKIIRKNVRPLRANRDTDK